MPLTVTKKRLIIWGAVGLALLVCLDGPLMRLIELKRYPGPQIGRIGFWMGHGAVLGVPLACLLVIGRWRKISDLMWLGIQGLVAMGLSAGWVHVFKHLIGRARPRLWDQGIVHFGPTYADSMDSFPSGHTAITMAVAFVISYHFPKTASFFMAAASLVAASRLLGGSHFPSDVAGGLVLGLVTGWLVVHITRPYSESKGRVEQP